MKEMTALHTEPPPVPPPQPRLATDHTAERNAKISGLTPSSLRKQSASALWLPIGFGLLFLVIWQLKGFHKLFHLELYQLPIPSAIGKAIQTNRDLLWNYSLYTGAEMLGGCLIGSSIGLLAAVAASFFPQLGKGAVTLVAAFNAVPIVALAPVMNNWFGDGIASKMAIVAIMTMAAMAVSAYKGLRSVEPAYLELMHSYAAGGLAIFYKLRLRLALPYIFTALKINMATGIIGAIVGEFFISSRGLGFLLSDQIKLGNMPIAWSCIVIAAALGIAFYSLIQLIERIAIPWHVARRKLQ
ncbi:ABC transporter permease [Paenibacillus sp. BK720]|uniref:ABC transporter permease n=1 Tax=Paenibacillus sp. BK720 TaxID=2587092 RepID=UPI001ABA5935|nr:ABC transporter permease [Paenibacillus sp. BK720]NIK70065.1 NitT/TauT family transport system permease protein [Paenibacillus sp. BK720]